MTLFLSFSSLPSSSSKLLAQPPPFSPSPVPRLQTVQNQVNSLNGAGLRLLSVFCSGRTALTLVKAAADVDGTGAAEEKAVPVDQLPLESKEEKAVPVDQLPLESKEREKMEQRMKMKLAKKLRLRRKRLVRKRHLRKKGRWPPSKMNKLKNV